MQQTIPAPSNCILSGTPLTRVLIKPNTQILRFQWPGMIKDKAMLPIHHLKHSFPLLT